MKMKKMAAVLSMAVILTVPPVSAEASFMDMAEIGWQAVKGAVQEDDMRIANEIAEIVVRDEAERERLRSYVLQTRSLILNETQYFKDTTLPAIAMANKIPFGNDAVFEGYVWKYENALEEDADTEVLKRFAELRGHSVDACADIADLGISAMLEHGEDGVSMIGGVMKLANYQQIRSRYESAANAIAFVLAAAGMRMEPVDDGNIFGIDNHVNVHQPPLNIFHAETNPPAEDHGESNGDCSYEKASYHEEQLAAEDLMLNNIALGDSAQTVFQRMGSPVKQERKSDGKIYYFYPSVEIHCKNDYVTTLVSNSSAAETSRGIHEGSPVQDVLSSYGNDYSKFQYENLEIYEYEITTEDGRTAILRFAINPSECVDYISIR